MDVHAPEVFRDRARLLDRLRQHFDELLFDVLDRLRFLAQFLQRQADHLGDFLRRHVSATGQGKFDFSEGAERNLLAADV